jgi:hypothetical protein
MSETTIFNVSGQIYQVSRSLLDQHPDTMLARCASTQWLADPTSKIFVDRDGHIFRYVLNYLRDGNVILPMNVSKNSLINELLYFGVKITDSSIKICQQATMHGAMAVNKLIQSLEKDEICICFTRLCITAYKCQGSDTQFQFYVRFGSSDVGKANYESAEAVSDGGIEMLERCNKYMESFGMIVKSVSSVEVSRHRPKYSVLVEIAPDKFEDE